MEHKPLVERLWGIVRTHSFAAFESFLHEACPDGSLKALAGALRHLAGAGQNELAQDLLSESLENHVISPQILWRLEMLLLVGQPGGGRETLDAQALATLERAVKELVLVGRLEEAVDRVAEAAAAGASPELYELLGRLHVRRGAAAPASAEVRPEAAAAESELPALAAAMLRAGVAPAVPSAAPALATPVQAPSAAEPENAMQALPRDEVAAVRAEPARPETPPAASAPVTPPAPVRSAPAQPSAPRAPVEAAEKPRSENSTPAWVAEELLKTRARAQEAMQRRAEAAKEAPAEAAEKPRSESSTPAWVAEELLKTRARAQEAMQKRAEAKAEPKEAPALVAIASSAAAGREEEEETPVEIPGPDEPKEQVFARLREAFARLGKIERKLLAWIMANPNQNAAQIAKNTELGSAEVTKALKGLTGLWLDPFTFAGYTVRDYVLECMSMGKSAPASASPSSRAPSQAASATRSVEAPRPARPAPRPESTPAPARSAAAAAPVSSAAAMGLGGLDLKVLEYIRNHPGCTPDEVMEAMGDEPASVSLVTLRRDWLDRDGEGRYRIKPAMLEQIPGADRPAAPARAVRVEDDDFEVPVRPREPRIAMERPAPTPRAATPSAPAPAPVRPSAAGDSRLAKLPKGQREILEFLHDNGKARTKDIARALEREAGSVNNALLGPLAGFVSVMHSFWRLNDEAQEALAAAREADS